MSFYLDTSLIVAVLTREPMTPAALNWFRSVDEEPLYISSWTLVEVASALSIKQRTGQISAEDRAKATAHWLVMVEANFSLLALAATHYEKASEFAGDVESKLRAGDALHLAIAAEHGLALVTLDKHMAMAAPSCGVPVADLGFALTPN